MPPIKKICKVACSLCDELKPLPYRYDVCEPCHQDIVNGKATDSEAAPTSDDEPEVEEPSDDEVVPEPVVPKNSVAFAVNSVQRAAGAALPKGVPRLVRS